MDFYCSLMNYVWKWINFYWFSSKYCRIFKYCCESVNSYWFSSKCCRESMDFPNDFHWNIGGTPWISDDFPWNIQGRQWISIDFHDPQVNKPQPSAGLIKRSFKIEVFWFLGKFDTDKQSLKNIFLVKTRAQVASCSVSLSKMIGPLVSNPSRDSRGEGGIINSRWRLLLKINWFLLLFKWNMFGNQWMPRDFRWNIAGKHQIFCVFHWKLLS